MLTEALIVAALLGFSVARGDGADAGPARGSCDRGDRCTEYFGARLPADTRSSCSAAKGNWSAAACRSEGTRVLCEMPGSRARYYGTPIDGGPPHDEALIAKFTAGCAALSGHATRIAP